MQFNALYSLMLAVVLVGVLPGCATVPTARPAEPEIKPHFTLGVDLSGCSHDARINDVSIIDGDFPVVVDVPVNEWVIPGENQLSIRLAPLPGETVLGESAKVEIRLQMRPKGAPRSEDRVLATVRFGGGSTDKEDGSAGSASGDGLVGSVRIEETPGQPGIWVHGTVAMSESLPRWAWLDGDVLPDTKGTQEAVEAQYQELWDMLATAPTEEQVLPLFAERSRELAIAYGVPEAKMAPTGLVKTAGSEEFEIVPMYLEHAKFKLFAGGRLAKIFFWSGGALFNFNHKTEKLSKQFDVTFRRSGGEWIITR